jgi:23S rRNA-intervening sequence protein
MSEQNPESEYRNPKQIRSTKFALLHKMPTSGSKVYDLEDRTLEFAKASRVFVKRLPRTIANIEDAKQFIRASGSIGANYIEANESIGKKDFVMKVKTCRREAEESG